ncbi:hypothetical protein EHV15_10275 [Paenibacillus oralis]|uniref:Uncharacterized protein n=1 Tax=Paenibacillus oralis TaxID=2490856 RepID=A0A3P3TYR7_9BACL|nr:hypothetical protein [Paenibacillus oralis]RRJ63262.1 hypothetical protein EHV15_10275 [Paenibacillus oralis]
MQVLRQRKALIFALLIFVVAAAAILAALFILKSSVKSSTSEAPVVFLRDNLLMMMQKDEQQPTELSGPLPQNELMQAAEPWRQMSYNRLFKLNEQRDKIFFVRELTNDSKAVLYYRDLPESPNTGGKPGVELASAISEVKETFFEISNDGKVAIYIKDYGKQTGGSLYIHNLRKEVLVDDQVTDYYYVDKPGLLYYMTFDEQNRQIIKMAKQNSFDKKTVIDTDVLAITEIDPDSGEIHYLKPTSTGSHDFYSKLPDQSPVKLVSNMQFNIGDTQEGSFFYRKLEPAKLTLFDAMTDDLAESDAKIKEPNSEDFTTVERKRMINYWTGEPYEADVEEFDKSGFNEANQRYEEKINRDSLRRELKARDFDPPGSLHFFSGGASVVVTDNYESLLLADAKTGMVIYKKADYATVPKVPLSEVSFPEEAMAKYEEHLNDAAEAYLFTPKTGTVKLDQVLGSSLSQVRLSLDGQKLYGIEKGGTLVAFDVEEGFPVHRKVLDEDVSLFQYFTEEKAKLFYYKRMGEGHALYEYANGASRQISADIGMIGFNIGKYYPQPDELYYFTEYDSDEHAGTLYRYRDGKSVKIADNVHEYYYNESSGLYYIVNFDWSQGTGDLMRAGDGKPEQVADRVRFMLEEPAYQRL